MTCQPLAIDLFCGLGGWAEGLLAEGWTVIGIDIEQHIGWFGSYAAMKEGIKQGGAGREWFSGDGKISRLTSSHSPARKFAFAIIAKIPLPLSRHIARTFLPKSALVARDVA